ncbi:MAG: hypothetical protein AABO57_15465 [Acidobacteriota bacterium]
MKGKKRTEIRLDIEETVVLRRYASPALAWCAGCAAMARMVSVDEAAAVAGTSARSIYRATERGEIHFSETPAGRLCVCLDSLSFLRLIGWAANS